MDEITLPGATEFKNLVTDLALELCGKGWMMAAAESCTGGWIAKCCTDLAGSSAWFERGFVTYSNAAKEELLGVDAGVLETPGAVSREVALQMAQGARSRAGVNIAVAVTGIAGPDGGTTKTQMYFGVSYANKKLPTCCCRLRRIPTPYRGA